jgi:hypothetical protein
MAESAGGDRGAIEQRIVQRSLEDGAFRRSLLEDPRAAIERELNTRLPAGVEIRAVEETPDTVYLVLPGRPTDAESGELSDRDLESVAGGEGAGDEYSAGWGPC